MRENLLTREEWGKVRVGKQNDRRIKILDEDKEYIKKLYEVDKLPIREIARIFEKRCSRRTIQFILFPERMHKVNYSGHYKKYYDKEKHKEYMRSHRTYIKDLLKTKKI